MDDSKENYIFDLGVKGLNQHFQRLEAISCPHLQRTIIRVSDWMNNLLSQLFIQYVRNKYGSEDKTE